MTLHYHLHVLSYAQGSLHHQNCRRNNRACTFPIARSPSCRLVLTISGLGVSNADPVQCKVNIAPWWTIPFQTAFLAERSQCLFLKVKFRPICASVAGLHRFATRVCSLPESLTGCASYKALHVFLLLQQIGYGKLHFANSKISIFGLKRSTD